MHLQQLSKSLVSGPHAPDSSDCWHILAPAIYIYIRFMFSASLVAYFGRVSLGFSCISMPVS